MHDSSCNASFGWAHHFRLVWTGNLGTLPVIIIPAICKEKGNPFGEPDACYKYGRAYASLSMAVCNFISSSYYFTSVDMVCSYPNKEKKNHLAIIDPIFVFLAGGSFGETLDWSCLFMVLCLQHNSDFLKWSPQRWYYKQWPQQIEAFRGDIRITLRCNGWCIYHTGS